MKLTKKFFCPVNGWDCPYWKEDGSCSMVDNGDDPVKECDDAAVFWEPDESYFVWADEDGTTYDVQELLGLGYHFIGGEPVFDPIVAHIMKTVAEILTSLPVEMEEIKIRNPNWEK